MAALLWGWSAVSGGDDAGLSPRRSSIVACQRAATRRLDPAVDARFDTMDVRRAGDAWRVIASVDTDGIEITYRCETVHLDDKWMIVGLDLDRVSDGN